MIQAWLRVSSLVPHLISIPAHLRTTFLVGLMMVLLSACGGGGGGSVTPAALNVPNLPPSPVSRVVLGTNYVGLFISKQPLDTDPTSPNSLRESQYLYQLNADNSITPVIFLDTAGTEFDLFGNLSFTEVENIVPLDIMVLDDTYILLTLFYRNFDTDPDNDYFNLLIDLRTGVAVTAPVGLNDIGNSGRSSLVQLGRDYFPPDARWNDTEDHYIVSVDYETLGMMQTGDFTPETQEPVDHHNGVICPELPDDEEEASDSGTDTTDTTTDTTDTDTTADADADTTTDTTEEETPADTMDTSTCTPGDVANSDGSSTNTSIDSSTGSGTATDTTTTDTSSTDTASTDTEGADSSSSSETPTGPGSFDEDGNPLTNGQDPSRFPQDNEPSEPEVVEIEELPVPTAIYRMILGGEGGYSLDKVSFDNDRPGLGQFVASRSGVTMYRNADGGDNAYRVIQDNCENVTGRLSTVLIAPYTSLVVADDENGESAIYEISENGMNKLIFNCNGNVIRRAHVSYSKRINSLRIPFNSPTIAGYDYAYPWFLNSSCDSGDLFPVDSSRVEMQNPMPPIPGLESGDPRGLRKSQFFNGKLYCIGYNIALELSVAVLDPTQYQPTYEFLNFDFGDWIPNFPTVHVLSDNNVIFTATSTTSNTPQTILLDDNGGETLQDDSLGGLQVLQQIEITPPSATAAN